VEPVGILFVAFGALVSLFGIGPAICVAVGSVAFTSTTLMAIPGMGGASITIPQVGLGLLLLLAVLRRGSLDRLLAVLRDEPAAQALCLFAVLATAGALLLPRLFAGETEVFTLARVAEIIIAVPLRPSSGNITQTLYMLSDVAAFLCVLVLVRDARDFRRFVRGFQTLVAVQVGFALIDAAGKYGLGRNVLDFLHTATYTMLTEVSVGGLWRLTGTYAEASYFAVFSAGQIALCASLARDGAGGRFWTACAVLLAGLVALSTSSAGYVFLGLCGAVLAALAVGEAARDRLRPATLALAFAVLAGIAAVLAVGLVSDTALAGAATFFDEMLFSKGQTDSGRERGTWNALAIENFQATLGLGIGLGSARSSSWILSLLGQTGVPGTVLYGAFVLAVLLAPRSPRFPALQRGFKAFVIATPVAATISWALVDLGLAFHMAAAMAVAAGRIREHT